MGVGRGAEMSLTGFHPLWDKILSQNPQAVADQGCQLEGSSSYKGTAYRGGWYCIGFPLKAVLLSKFDGMLRVYNQRTFGDSVSAAARAKRWGVSRQANESFIPSGSNFSPYLLDGACYQGYLGNLGRQKENK
jgi:hypothetical protein